MANRDSSNMRTDVRQRGGKLGSHESRGNLELVTQRVEGSAVGKNPTLETLALALNNDETTDDWKWLEDKALDTFMEETLGSTDVGHLVKYEGVGELNKRMCRLNEDDDTRIVTELLRDDDMGNLSDVDLIESNQG